MEWHYIYSTFKKVNDLFFKKAYNVLTFKYSHVCNMLPQHRYFHYFSRCYKLNTVLLFTVTDTGLFPSANHCTYPLCYRNSPNNLQASLSFAAINSM